MGEDQPRKFAQITKESVKMYAESAGVDGLSDDAAVLLAEDVCYRLRQATQASSQYMKHAKRKKLTSEDFNRALKWLDVEPIYGYGSQDPLPFRATKDADLYFTEDKEVNLPEIAMDSKIPASAGKTIVKAHWLAVEGVQKAKEGQTGAQGKRNGHVQAPTLSDDLLKYYEHITKAILGSDEEVMKVALDDLRTNSKVSSLLPYLVNFVSVSVKRISHDLGQLTKLLHIVTSITYNSVLYLGPYLIQLVSGVMYCILEPLAASINPLNDHWALRDYAARLLAHICRTYNSSVNNLRHQLYLTFQEVLLDAARPLCSHYGAVVGLTALGPKAIEDVLLPQLSSYWPTLLTVLEDTSISNTQVKEDGHKVYGAILLAAEHFLKYKLKESSELDQASGNSSPSQSPGPDQTEFAFGTASHLLQLGSSTTFAVNGAAKLKQIKKSVAEWYSELYDYFGSCLCLQLDTAIVCEPEYETKEIRIEDIAMNPAPADTAPKDDVEMTDVEKLQEKFPRSRELRALQGSGFPILGQRRRSHSPKLRTRTRHRTRSLRGSSSVLIKDVFAIPKNLRSRTQVANIVIRGQNFRPLPVSSQRKHSLQRSAEECSISNMNRLSVAMKVHGKPRKVSTQSTVTRRPPSLMCFL
ncbi:TAF6-like RNA polymerase II p300/CBP-associated factor-associated factor 65 kDa subunit 6L [Ptychodera flava]|uniref:TAF6-like RNA polymerase II p300/CBP-associated factor-associated factor 65 kDa subunit 6L n=1 Tax=Ptychodera flava TaxID=63121 RepID=UPI00396A4A9A